MCIKKLAKNYFFINLNIHFNNPKTFPENLLMELKSPLKTLKKEISERITPPTKNELNLRLCFFTILNLFSISVTPKSKLFLAIKFG
jgi:hypothetical protein